MKILLSKLKSLGAEILIIVSFVIVISLSFGKVQNHINSDGLGYYDYLPSIFIYHDLIRKNDPIQENLNLYNRVISTGVYVDYNDYKVNKYTSGTALLQLPFFTCTYFLFNLEGNSNDGYQKPFQKTVLFTTIFYLFLSISLLKKVLLLYDIKKNTIIFCQIILVFATSITHYANLEAGFSHVYSLFAITAFIYFVKSFFLFKKSKHIVLAFAFLGLIFILRQSNILIVLFIPFLAGSIANIRLAFTTLLSHIRAVLLGIILFLGIVSIQLILWYLQTGDFMVYSYQGESFNFLDPYFWSILFSYQKGLFVYTPVLFIATLSLFWLAFKKHFYLFFSWVVFFVILTYVFSSWWCWSYGCSYGLRAYIDFYSIFLIPFALMLDGVKKVPRILLIALSLSTIPLNVIQTYQYKRYILHWDNMDKEKYWKVFLKTNNRYSGLVWKNNLDLNHYTSVCEIDAGDIYSPKKTNTTVFNVNSKDIPGFDKVSVIQVIFDHDFADNNDSKVVLRINKELKDSTYYYSDRFLIHFHQKKLNKWQTGLFNFDFEPITDQQQKIISIELKTGNQNECLKNVRLKFLSKISY